MRFQGLDPAAVLCVPRQSLIDLAFAPAVNTSIAASIVRRRIMESSYRCYSSEYHRQGLGEAPPHLGRGGGLGPLQKRVEGKQIATGLRRGTSPNSAVWPVPLGFGVGPERRSRCLAVNGSVMRHSRVTLAADATAPAGQLREPRSQGSTLVSHVKAAK